MANIISGSIAVLIVILFLGGLAISIGSIPFSIIVIGVLGLTITDFIESVKNNNNKNGARD